ncbi:hypothetical protein GOP47_0021094 [Adiantum capillus-veneris]|uniref:IST1-like protein n=1 Tax=Adiantum capillus-veneris TaxID=13818 RepID=A0A9D4UC08_ADICA|nr:hypothetical protein GOP47_0021094 [Adiantum capillus-veneris]
MFDAVFGRSFNSAKCKTSLRLAVSRIKLLRNKRDIQLKQMKRELAQLLQTNQEPSARIRVEHIYREQNIMAAYEVIELFCELIVVRLPIIESQRQCPIDLREAVASLIFAAPRCSDVPELLQVRNLLSGKYGKEFVVAAAELRPDCGVNRLIIEKLSVRAPSGEVKLKLMKDIAEENNVGWDPSATESELLKAPEDLLEGPTRFLGASQMALDIPPEEPSVVESVVRQNQINDLEESTGAVFESNKVSTGEKQFIPFVLPVVGQSEPQVKQQPTSQTMNLQEQNDRHDEYSPLNSLHKEISFGSNDGEDATLSSSNRAERYKDVVAAARAAAESAERAAAAARAAAQLASQKFERTTPESSVDSGDDDDTGDIASDLETRYPDKRHSSDFDTFNKRSANGKPLFDEPEDGEEFRGVSSFPTENPFRRTFLDDDTSMGSQSVVPSSARIGKFDDQDGSTGAPAPQFDSDQTEARDAKTEEKFNGEDEPSTVRTTSINTRVHPKLPDYDELTARFEALRSKR